MARVNIRDELKKRDWKIANLARAAKVSYPTAWAAAQDNWPTDRVTWGTIRAIAKALGVKPGDLLHNNGTE